MQNENHVTFSLQSRYRTVRFLVVPGVEEEDCSRKFNADSEVIPAVAGSFEEAFRKMLLYLF